MAGGSVSGVVGQIKWHFYICAAVNNYTVTRSQDNVWSLRGTVVLSDAFKMSQTPLMFVALHAKGEWRWPIQTVHVRDGGALTASLGPPLEK